MSIDPRIAERRTEVREGSARGDARRLLRWFAVLAVLAIIVWIAQLPAFSVKHVDVAGADRGDVAGALSAEGVDEGTPLVLIRPGDVERALLDDPWISSAAVEHRFPDTVVVEVTERVPVVNIRSAGRVLVIADDGVVVSTTTDQSVPMVDLTGVAPTPTGEVVDDTRAAGVSQFIHVLPAPMVDAGSFREESAELWYLLPGIDVRLGRAVDMEAKAYALEALIAEGIQPGSTIHLVSASRPAVESPAPSGEAAEDDADETATDNGSTENP